MVTSVSLSSILLETSSSVTSSMYIVVMLGLKIVDGRGDKKQKVLC
jgi:hypothetical protein